MDCFTPRGGGSNVREIPNPSKETFMNRALIVIALLVVAVIGLGFYFGYFRIGWDSSDGMTHITLTVDQNKIQGDEKKAVQKVQGRE
jgi:hypothetical protein